MESELRKHPRVSGYAKAILLGHMTPGYVRDLSRHGCQIAFMQAVPVAVGELITIRVIAEHDPSLPPFEVALRVRWVKPDSIWFALGGEVESLQDPESEAVYDKLLGYYAGTAR